MNVNVSKDYDLWETIRKYDLYNQNHGFSVTSPLDYHYWETIEVESQQICELYNQGYGIIIL